MSGMIKEVKVSTLQENAFYEIWTQYGGFVQHVRGLSKALELARNNEYVVLTPDTGDIIIDYFKEEKRAWKAKKSWKER